MVIPNATSYALIEPSSPTPPHLKTLELLFLDQLSPPVHFHIILYFKPFHLPQKSDNIRRSLSEALAVYYPLAGRLHEGSWIDCNDAGAEYTETWFHDGRVMDVVENSDPEELRQYVPDWPRGGAEVPLAVQVSFFGCGGIAIGVCVAHRVADAMSLAMFVNAWAAACRGDDKTLAATRPSFSLAHRFPQANFSRFFSREENPWVPLSPTKIVSKRFVFDNSKLSALKKAASGPLIQNPTKVEAVTAFFWRHFIDAKVQNKNCSFAVTHAVDIRRRANPPLPHNYFGNACARAMAMVDEAGEMESDLNYYDLALKLRNSISKTDSTCIARLEKGDEFLEYFSRNEENNPIFKEGGKSLEVCGFTSWHRLPVYEADYGWGKPVWVSIVGVPMKNLICFMGSRDEEGMEAWVNMGEEEMDVIERSYKLL